MGCSVRAKHIGASRRARSVKTDVDHGNLTESSLVSKTAVDSGIRPLNYQLALNESAQNSIPNRNPNFDDGGGGYCTEEKLEEILLKNLEFLYNEAISKLVAMGYDEDVALKAILRSGHCCSGMDVLTNIMRNSLTYLGNGGGCGVDGGNTEGSEPNFVDLRQLEEYSLATMVCLLQQLRPHLSKGDAMWCLLMSELHLGRASVMEIPVLPSAGNNGWSSSAPSNVESVGNNLVGVAPALCRFHRGWGFGNGGTSEFPGNGFFSYASEMTLQKETEYPKRFNLTPSMKSLLKRNVTMFAAGFRANSKQLQMQSQAGASSLPIVDSSVATVSGDEVPSEWTKELLNSKNQDVVNSVLSKFCDLNLDENTEYVPEDQKDEMILTLIHQIKDLERQVKERKEWAHQKAMQAARKLSNDIMELKMLRMEKEETQRLKKGKQTLEDTTMKRLLEMENALRKASGQVDRANATVRRLETENAEIRADMEAAKLSASESIKTCLEVAKREKKCLKRLLAWEKQKTKLQEEIAAEKQKTSELQQQLVQVEAAQREAEGKWGLEQEAREVAQAQVDKERSLKEATEASIKRKHEALQLKIEIDSQCHKDDLQRLEQELSRLKASMQSAELHQQSNGVSTANSEGEKPQGETTARLLNKLDKLGNSSDKDVSHQRECLICLRDEVSVVFLPCAHQVLCTNCNEEYGKKGKATCPCCRVPIEERIRVFGVSS